MPKHVNTPEANEWPNGFVASQEGQPEMSEPTNGLAADPVVEATPADVPAEPVAEDPTVRVAVVGPLTTTTFVTELSSGESVTVTRNGVVLSVSDAQEVSASAAKNGVVLKTGN